MHQSIPAAPSLPLRADPREFAFFFLWMANSRGRGHLRGCPCKNRPLDFRPKTEFLQIFRVRQLVHVKNKNGNNLAFNAIFQYFWRQFQRTVQNRLNRSVSSQI